jgi:hypothetical protein
VIGEHTGAASAYVGMTRGRQANTAHLVAADLADAREQWIAVSARDRADIGPAHAADLAAREAARYAEPRPLEQVLADLHGAWATEENCRVRLALDEPIRDRLRQIVALGWDPYERMQAAKERHLQTWREADRAEKRLRDAEVIVGGDTDRIRDKLLQTWIGQRDPVRQAARVVLQGPGLLGLRRGAVTRAGAQLMTWGDTWRPVLPGLPTDSRGLAEHVDHSDYGRALWTAFDAAARRTAERAHPDCAALQPEAASARKALELATHALENARREETAMVGRFGGIALSHDPAGQLAELDRELTADHTALDAAQARIAQLTAEPALLGQPAGRLNRERDTWRARRDADIIQRHRDRPEPPEPSVYGRHRQEEYHARSHGRPDCGTRR